MIMKSWLKFGTESDKTYQIYSVVVGLDDREKTNGLYVKAYNRHVLDNSL
jgi:hypothetical protein